MIRPMEQADVRQAADLAASSMPQPWSRQAFAAELKNPYSMLLVSTDENDGSIQGYVSLQITPDDAELTGIAVRADRRRRGIARRMLRESKRRLQERQISRIVLEVRVSNEPAVAFYRKAGFHPSGVRRGFYDMPKEDALVMEAALTDLLQDEMPAAMKEVFEQ